MPKVLEALCYKQPAVFATSAAAPITRVSKPEDFLLDEAGDVVRFFKLPPGAKILGGSILSGDADTGNSKTLSLRISNGTQFKDLITDSVVGRAGGVAYHSGAEGSAEFYGFVTPHDRLFIEVACGVPGTGQLANLQASVTYTQLLEGGEAPRKFGND